MLDLDKIRARLAAAAVTARDSQCDVFALRELVALHEGNAQDMLSEFDRLTTALAAAQAAPVVEWYATTVGEAARVGMFWMSIGPGGWTLRVRLPYGFGAGELIEEGPETGPAGKAACEAAYRRACGLPAIPACAG